MTGKFHKAAALSMMAGAALFGGVASAQTTDAATPLDLASAIQNGTPIFEFRPRYESVQQYGRADAESFTARTRLGWQTQKWNNLVGLIEFEDVRQLGGSESDDGVWPNDTNSHGVRFATIQDPEVTELNRLQLTWTPNEWLTVTGGRQRINLDDQRFIGSVAWRQDEQTFDALRFDADFGRLDIMYAYIGHVNRIAAEDLDYGSDSNLLNVSYTFSAPLKVTAFYYAIDNHDDIEPTGSAVFNAYANTAENSSNTTYGARVSGNTWVGRFRLNYAATYATQSDNSHALIDYNNIEYHGGEFSATLGPTTGRIAYESLGSGDATLKATGAATTNRGFATPFATLHAFQGWADVFLNTPADGITDLNASVIVNPRWRRDHLFNINLLARYHDFNFERTGDAIGSEWDLSASANITRRLSWIVKYADFAAETDSSTGANPTPSTTKTWVGLEFKL